MKITHELLMKATKNRSDKAAVIANMESVISSLEKYGSRVGLDQPHRLTHYLAQLAHESMRFAADRERANKGERPGEQYEGRKDLGNTRPGDGVRYPGRGPMQLTGRRNYAAFSRWARTIDSGAPDFEAEPEKINTDPWEGLSAIWYWDEGNPTGKSLNKFADQNNIEMITRRINGGLNGFADRIDLYDQFALVMLGYGPEEYTRFQLDAKSVGLYDGEVDGLTGPKTRTALHTRLVRMTGKEDRAAEVKPAPVTVEKPVPVVVPGSDKPWWQAPEIIGPATAGPALTGLAAFDWRALAIIVPLILLFVGWLIVRRDRAKEKQAAAVQVIADANLTTAAPAVRSA